MQPGGLRPKTCAASYASWGCERAVSHLETRRRGDAATRRGQFLRVAVSVPLAAAVLLLMCTACGRKAPPRSPEDVRPATITDLSATNTPEGIQLSWSRPRTYADGSRMPDLGGFVIERADGAEPHASFARLETIAVSDRDRFRQVKRFRHLDRGTTPGLTYRYRVVSFTVDRYFSAPSNLVTIERAIPGDKHASLPAA